MWPEVLFVERRVFDDMSPIGVGVDDRFLAIESVIEVRESPSQTPVNIERRMNAHGETHMGGFVVTFTMTDGHRFVHESGDFCEFVTVPRGYKPAQIVGVEFDDARRMKRNGPDHYLSPDFKYCLFELPSTELSTTT